MAQKVKLGLVSYILVVIGIGLLIMLLIGMSVL